MMDRRTFLATATTAAAASATGFALPDRVTPAAISAASDRLDWHVAAGRVAQPEAMSRLLREDLAEIIRAARQAPPAVRSPLLSIAARFAEYLGWMRQEADDAPGAMYWTDRAGDFAQAANWKHMVAYTYIRKALILQHEQPDHAADMATVARRGPWLATPGLAALAAAHEAEAHAEAGRAGSSRRALDLVQRYGARIDPADEPALGSRSMTPDRLLRLHTARCDLRLGIADSAISNLLVLMPHLQGPRWRMITEATLASAYAKAGAIDEACRTAQDAMQHGVHCSSATARRELRQLRPALRPWAGRDDVRQVLDALPA